MRSVVYQCRACGALNHVPVPVARPRPNTSLTFTGRGPRSKPRFGATTVRANISKQIFHCWNCRTRFESAAS